MISDVLAEEIDIPLNEHYILYFDVLGYKSFFESKPNEHKKFLIDMRLATSSIESIIRQAATSIHVQLRTYSDNFLLYFEKNGVDEYEALKLLSVLARKIQLLFLERCRIVVRGGITVGEFYADESIVFGQGLIRAVELEDKIAKNPRVVIDNNYFQETTRMLFQNRYLEKDTDDLYYVNYFYDKFSLRWARGYCIYLVNHNCKYHPTVKDEAKILQQEKTISKYLWMLVKFNEACRKTGNESLQIDYKLTINERLLKLEVACEDKTSK